MSHPRVLLGALTLSMVLLTATTCSAAIVFEVFNNRAAFDTRLGAAPRVVDFDDVDTSAVDPAPIAATRYKYSKGVVITGEDGQFVSPVFDAGSNLPSSSPPNQYAPGPVSDVMNQGGNETDLAFFAGLRRGQVAGVGVVFIDPDNPAQGPCSMTVFDEGDQELATTGTLNGADGSQVFAGIVAIDNSTDMPVAAIFGAHFVTGSGWVGNPDNESAALDDLVFSAPQPLTGNAGEICGNCDDDDDDGLTDRFDDECRPPAFGPNGGLDDPKGAGKAAVGCQKVTEKAGAKFVGGKVKHLQKCLQAVGKCVQTKNGDQACLDKATGTCAKEIGKISADEDTLTSKIEKGCGSLGTADIQSGNGLGYGAEEELCADLGVSGGIANASDIAACVVRQHECAVERLTGRITPRAAEFLTIAGHDVDNEFPCMETGANGNGQGLPTDEVKALRKCDVALQKTGAGLLTQTFKFEQKCNDGAATCLQIKPTDPNCLPKAQAKCQKQLEKLATQTGKLFAKASGQCLPVSFADLASAQGLGLGAIDTQCMQLGFGADTLDDVLECVAFDHLCQALQMSEKQTPRSRELLDRIDIDPLD